MFWESFTIIIVLIVNCCRLSQTDELSFENANTDIASEPDDRLLLLSMLDGNLLAIEQRTGQVKWKIRDKPLVKVPTDMSDAIIPLFLPDPRDGSIYLLGDSKEPLKKLPFTVPQLVASSPCRSSDGVLYTGKKKDVWFVLDPKTGEKQQILGWDMGSPTCPVQTPEEAVYIGRTQYTLLMKGNNRKWNITFCDYKANAMTKEMLNNYGLVHFASSSTGRILTLDRRNGLILWDKDFGSPLIGSYMLDPDGLISVPFTSLANHTLYQLASDLSLQESPHLLPGQMKLYPTLYIGEHSHGLYALPSLVDQNTVTITSSEVGPLLLDGPGTPDNPRPYPEIPVPGHNYHMPKGTSYSSDSFQSIPRLKNISIVFIGHYNIPEYSETKILVAGRPISSVKLLTDESSASLGMKRNVDENPSIGVQTEENIKEPENISITVSIYRDLKYWINQQENKGLKLLLIILVGCIIAMFWYLKMQVREMQQLSQNGSKSNQQSNSSNRNGSVSAIAEELEDGMVQIGKITFHPEQLLGKGCEGTFVYRGEFDRRRVAVKRLLPECFNFADREVALLRESDAHPHVVRYYCMEQDRMFRYIALELCQATVHDYVQGKCDRSIIQPLEILRQATEGLAHLHSLDIVHRDIKPQNVLLSVPNAKGEVRAMISDFGLCKKLQVGRVSFSRRSGITGTDGWIAPEMLLGTERTTCAVDLFSLGCLFYYVLSEGSHPFGDALRRQANILSGECDLGDLKGPPWHVEVVKVLLQALTSSKPTDRPSCAAVLEHPMFWNNTKILAFLQDVSDRVEKAESDDPILTALERGGSPVVRGDWRILIDEEVARDLRKYRSYRGESLRDLLRALRNKKHHFRELTPLAQKNLGEIPDEFTNYWTLRFPLLLLHVWLSMQLVADEPSFNRYYHPVHRYPLIDFTEYESNLEGFDLERRNVDEYFSKKKKENKYNRYPFKRKPRKYSDEEGTDGWFVRRKENEECPDDLIYKKQKFIKKNRVKEVDWTLDKN